MADGQKSKTVNQQSMSLNYKLTIVFRVKTRALGAIRESVSSYLEKT